MTSLAPSFALQWMQVEYMQGIGGGIKKLITNIGRARVGAIAAATPPQQKAVSYELSAVSQQQQRREGAVPQPGKIRLCAVAVS
jgi:hypothetical protein